MYSSTTQHSSSFRRCTRHELRLVRALLGRGRLLAPQLEDVHIEQPASGTAIAVFAGEHDLAMKRQVHELLTGLLDDNELVIADFSQAQFVDS